MLTTVQNQWIEKKMRSKVNRRSSSRHKIRQHEVGFAQTPCHPEFIERKSESDSTNYWDKEILFDAFARQIRWPMTNRIWEVSTTVLYKQILLQTSKRINQKFKFSYGQDFKLHRTGCKNRQVSLKHMWHGCQFSSHLIWDGIGSLARETQPIWFQDVQHWRN